MKKSFILLSLVTAINFIGCDKIKDPIEKKNTAVGSNFITKSNALVSNFKKVLLEDYTGHTCGNCPAAAIKADSLAAAYTSSLVVIAVHAGFFAKVKANYPTSYTTTVGNDWDGSSGFGISAVGNPNGMVNRKDYAGNGLIQKESKWPTTVKLGLEDPFIVKLDVTTNYDPSVRALNTNVKAIFKTNYPNSIKLSVVLTEDEIIGAQTDYTKIPDLVPDYKYQHMLRDAINGSWGDILKTAPIVINDSAKVVYPNFALNSSFNDNNISVIVFAYDALTKEVLQVEKVKIK